MTQTVPSSFNPRFTNKLPKVSMVYPESKASSAKQLMSSTGHGPTAKSIFAQHYKEINFDTLKERHDNFCFEKVLETKNQLHDTVYFNNPIPGNPANNLVLFMKQANETPAAMM